MVRDGFSAKGSSVLPRVIRLLAQNLADSMLEQGGIPTHVGGNRWVGLDRSCCETPPVLLLGLLRLG
jgi:hypothetical protein